MELKGKEVMAVEERLRKIEALCRGNLRAENHIRMIRLTLNKAKKRDGKL